LKPGKKGDILSTAVMFAEKLPPCNYLDLMLPSEEGTFLYVVIQRSVNPPAEYKENNMSDLDNVEQAVTEYLLGDSPVEQIESDFGIDCRVLAKIIEVAYVIQVAADGLMDAEVDDESFRINVAKNVILLTPPANDLPL